MLVEPEREIGVGGIEVRGEAFKLGEDGGDFGGVGIVGVAFEGGKENGDGVGGFVELRVGPADPVEGFGKAWFRGFGIGGGFGVIGKEADHFVVVFLGAEDFAALEEAVEEEVSGFGGDGGEGLAGGFEIAGAHADVAEEDERFGVALVAGECFDEGGGFGFGAWVFAHGVEGGGAAVEDFAGERVVRVGFGEGVEGG